MCICTKCTQKILFRLLNYLHAWSELVSYQGCSWNSCDQAFFFLEFGTFLEHQLAFTMISLSLSLSLSHSASGLPLCI